MSRYFDTSVLAKLYVPERGSAEVARLVRSEGDAVVFSMLHELELVNGLRLKAFRKEATSVEIDSSLQRVRRDLASGVLARPTFDWAAALVQARDLADAHATRIGCRSLDVLHVASALCLASTSFVTADDRQGKLAKHAGMSVVKIG